MTEDSLWLQGNITIKLELSCLHKAWLGPVYLMQISFKKKAKFPFTFDNKKMTTSWGSIHCIKAPKNYMSMIK